MKSGKILSRAAMAAIAIGAIGAAGSMSGSLPIAASTSDWTMYGHDIAGSDLNTGETTLTTATVPHLGLQWTAHGSVGTSAQPIVLNGLVYWGDWAGIFHATAISGPRAGTDVWTVPLGKTNASTCDPPVAGIASTPAVGSINGTTVLYIGAGGNDAAGGGNDYLDILNAATGAMIHQTVVGSAATTAGGFPWSSPVLYNGSVYMGTASLGDCPLQRGSMMEFDATTGAILHQSYMVPTGCIAGAIWGTPSIDTATGMMYVATGTPTKGTACSGAAGDLSMSVVEMRASDLSVVAHWRIPPAQAVGDGDFGSVPTLFTGDINGVSTPMVGVGNKNGYFYAFRRSAIAAGPVWSFVFSGGCCHNPRLKSVIDPAVWDGQTLYEGGGLTTVGGVSCKGSIAAFVPGTGAVKWQSCLAGEPVGALAATPGVIYATLGESGQFVALDMATGKVIFTYNEPGGGFFWAPPTPAEGHVFIMNMDSTLTAFAPPSTSTPTPCTGPSSAPSGAAATAIGGGQITVTWTAPATSCTPVTAYAIYTYGADGTTFMDESLTTSFTRAGLSPNTYHVFTITAWNGSAWSAWSGWSNWALAT